MQKTFDAYDKAAIKNAAKAIVNYCQKKELSFSDINEDYPGQINNQDLVLKDDECLKLNTDNRIIINSKNLINILIMYK
mgnify:CR=1 FL=1